MINIILKLNACLNKNSNHVRDVGIMNMPLLQLKNAEITFGGKPIFSELNLQIFMDEKICLVGRNGCGKSSLLKVMAKEIELDKGELFFNSKSSLGYLPQTITFDQQFTVYDYVLKGIDLLEHESLEEKKYLADIILSNLGLHGNIFMYRLSGGKLRRVALAKALVSKPSLLLLDEPTNHLDISSIEWLEEYLINYQGSFVCISHDREFLKNISKKTFWLDRSKLKVNNHGFSEFEQWYNTHLEQEEHELQKLDKKMQQENLWLQQGVTARRKRNQGRLKDLYALRAQLKNDKNNFQQAGANIKLPSLSSNMAGKMVLEMQNVSFTYPNAHKPMINNFSIRILRGEKIGIMGRNGAGKTTFLKLIMQEISPAIGTIKLGSNVEISYIDQKRITLDPRLTLWQTMASSGGDTIIVNGRPKHVASYLKDFLFNSEQINSPVETLSGGEANRLLLAKILANPGNLLILDEPTNDLDIDTLDMLEELLSQYSGTLLVVSHDREFLERVVTRTVIFEPGKITDFIGGYYNYKNQAKEIKKNNLIKKEPPANTNKISKLSYKFKHELENLPSKIEAFNTEITEIETKLSDNNLYQQNNQQFSELTEKLIALKHQLDKAESRWFELEEMKENHN